jgi:hypothetical protein
MRVFDGAAVPPQAGNAVQELEAWGEDPDPAGLLGTALREILADDDAVQRLSWDDAAQLCLGLAAWREATGGGPPGFAPEHDGLSGLLRFRPSPDGGAWNSPHGYSPAVIAPRLKALRTLLDAWLKAPQPPAGK